MINAFNKLLKTIVNTNSPDIYGLLFCGRPTDRPFWACPHGPTLKLIRRRTRRFSYPTAVFNWVTLRAGVLLWHPDLYPKNVFGQNVTASKVDFSYDVEDDSTGEDTGCPRPGLPSDPIEYEFLAHHLMMSFVLHLFICICN